MNQIKENVKNPLKVFEKYYGLKTTIVIVKIKGKEYKNDQIKKAKLENI